MTFPLSRGSLVRLIHCPNFSAPCTDSFVDVCVVQDQSETRRLVLISGFIHDVGSFIDEHPGGAHLLKKYVGKDATTAFFGGVYDHSNAAHNVRPFSFPSASFPSSY